MKPLVAIADSFPNELNAKLFKFHLWIYDFSNLYFKHFSYCKMFRSECRKILASKIKQDQILFRSFNNSNQLIFVYAAYFPTIAPIIERFWPMLIERGSNRDKIEAESSTETLFPVAKLMMSKTICKHQKDVFRKS